MSQPVVEPEEGVTLRPDRRDDVMQTMTIEAVGPPQSVAEGVVGARGGDPAANLSAANDALRRARLRAAAGFLAVILGLLVSGRALSGGGPLVTFQGAAVGVLGLAYALLAGKLPLSGRRLRQVEFTVFAVTSAYLAARQYQGMLDWVRAGDEASVIAAVKTTLIGTMMLSFAYCMLIPNTWRAAAVVVVAMTAVPIVTEAAVFRTNRRAFDLAVKSVRSAPNRVYEDVVMMLLAVGLSVYGTHVINGLRTEAYEARQLNQYFLVRRLGTGGMGEVHLAEHRLLKRPCAVKIIRPGHAADPIELARFEREVRATARLSHPNTVEVFDYGRTEDGTFFYVMEYLRGLSLDDLVKRHGPMPPGRVIYLLRQVCGALAEAHDAGLVHRDVKPANIFASYLGGECDVAKLLDFGLVKGRTGGTSNEAIDVARQGMVRGTPLYMSPEQILGDCELDHRCDIYALGAVAYRLLTGLPPFVRDTRQEVMSAHAFENPLPPSRRKPDLPADIERVVMRCLSKSPAERYPDALSLSDAMAACASAPEWNSETARLWWRQNEPDALKSPVGEPDSSPGKPSPSATPTPS